MNDNQSKILFSISTEDAQREALNYIGRKLTDKEMYVVKKGIEYGLLFDIETVFKTAIQEATDQN